MSKSNACDQIRPSDEFCNHVRHIYGGRVLLVQAVSLDSKLELRVRFQIIGNA